MSNNRYRCKRDVSSRLINVVSCIPDVSDFIDKRQRNVLLKQLGTRPSEETKKEGRSQGS